MRAELSLAKVPILSLKPIPEPQPSDPGVRTARKLGRGGKHALPEQKDRAPDASPRQPGRRSRSLDCGCQVMTAVCQGTNSFCPYPCNSLFDFVPDAQSSII